ncbi:hypothetical protein [Ruminococcus bromii]|uniref:hypothetical protein n=1 Tax=Ruminococcus bromii TaxID=40518 RepID=UPI003AB3269A
MKKAIGIALLAVFLVSMSGCAKTERQTTEGRTVSESSTMSDEESSGAMESREPEEDRTVSCSDSKESSEESTAAAGTESPAVETESAAAESKTTESQSPPAEETRSAQTESSKSVETQTTPPPQAEQTEEMPPEEESTPQTAEEPTVPEFDIQTWVDYAMGYAESVGLNLSPDATACWDNPITAGSHSLYLERDIQSRLNRYSRDGDITDVWIWAEERSDGSYDLYIGYA